MLTTVQGEKVALDGLVRRRARVGISVDGPFVVDVACFGLGPDGRLDEAFFIFYNQTASPDGSVSMSGVPRSGAAIFDVDLVAVPGAVEQLVFTAVIDGPGAMADIRSGQAVVSEDGVDVLRFDLGSGLFTEERAVIVAELYRRGVGWRFAGVAQGFNGGFEKLVERFGGHVDAGNDRPAAPAGGPSKALPDPPTTTAAPPQWYPDPSNPSLVRWWDGAAWTAHTAPSPPVVQPAVRPAPPPPPAPPEGERDRGVSVPDAVLRRPRGGVLSGGKKALEEENDQLRRALADIGATEREQLRADIKRLQVEHDQLVARLGAKRAAAQAELARVRADVVATADEAILQEAGIYRYRHPLTDAVAYKARLAELNDQIKAMTRAGHAVVGATTWQVNGSLKEGAHMVKDFSKLMLRAYNNEADNAVRSMKPYKLETSVQRLDKVRSTITNLGKTMSIQVTENYHRLRVAELELTADYLARVAEEKEREREERERLREEEKARRELMRERERLEKEQAHYRTALEAMRVNGDLAAVADAEAKLAEIGAAIEGVDQRAANVRAGYVYVISNIGAFGERMIKVGMTRRLEPMDRVRELGDASVPFRYDVHALVFSDDAVGLESRLHRALDDRRVNIVNARREFFYATANEVRDLLADIAGSALLHFTEEPEALEWHQSENLRSRPE
jgi:stress response protein SCP2